MLRYESHPPIFTFQSSIFTSCIKSYAFPHIPLLANFPPINEQERILVRGGRSLPVLSDIESPLELEMLLLIVVNEGAGGGVVATGEHAGRGVFFGDWKAVLGRCQEHLRVGGDTYSV